MSSAALKQKGGFYTRLVKKDQKGSFFRKLVKQRFLLFLLIPGLLNFIIWHYLPMYGITVAFKEYSYRLGIFRSPWAEDFGIGQLVNFLTNPLLGRLVWNTVYLNLLMTLFLPLPGMIFALALNEMRSLRYKRAVQTISYFPFFLSSVLIVGIFTLILSPSTGIVNNMIKLFGGTAIYFIMLPQWFRPLMLIMSSWQSIGWDTIIWLAKIATIDPQLYESATVDGAGRLRRMWFITLPAFKEWYVIGLILSFGSLLASSGFEKNLLLYQTTQGAIAETAQTIGIFLYVRGLQTADYSYGSMVGMLNMVVCLLMLLMANYVSRKLIKESIW